MLSLLRGWLFASVGTTPVPAAQCVYEGCDEEERERDSVFAALRPSAQKSDEVEVGGEEEEKKKGDRSLPEGYDDDPPTISEIGSGTWTLLHTMAAVYPEEPTIHEQHDMKRFLRALGQFYPCLSCARHFQSSMRRHPPAVHSRDALSVWVCERHNEVNRYLKKPEFDCDLVLQRWLYGFGENEDNHGTGGDDHE